MSADAAASAVLSFLLFFWDKKKLAFIKKKILNKRIISLQLLDCRLSDQMGSILRAGMKHIPYLSEGSPLWRELIMNGHSYVRELRSQMCII